MKTIDYLIVGQGVAGTLLAHFLSQSGQSILVVDEYRESAASQVAAGIINPITGRRYVKSWRIDDLLPIARRTYRELEALLGVPVFYERNIIRTLFNQGEENDWLARTAEPGYAPYMLDRAELGEYALKTTLAYGYGELSQAGQADLPALTRAYRAKLMDAGQLMSEPFDFEALEIGDGELAYKGVNARNLVFCEGHRGAGNPYFGYLPFGGAKGEVLLVRIPGANFEKILKHRVFIVPMAEAELYWIGATYGWSFADEAPTPEGRAYLEERLHDLLGLPFEVVAHRAAVRPTVKDRRPFLGRHPDFPQLAIFNGLGTKGASLGPYWAKHLAEHLMDGAPLEGSVDIGRFT